MYTDEEKMSMREKMADHFYRIRQSYGKMREYVLDVIADVSNRDNKDKNLYKSDVLEERKTERNARAIEGISGRKSKALQQIDAEFAAIGMDLMDWVTEEPPQKFTTMLNAFMRFDVQMSPSEIKILRDLSDGNYLSSKIVSVIAGRQDIDTKFVSIEEIKSMLSEAKRSTHDAISAFAGVMDANCTYQADALELPIASDMAFFREFAERFGQEGNDDALARAERLLCSVTDSDYTLSPSKRKEIDSLFADATTDSQRVKRAADLIEQGGTLADLLPLYDAKLYQAALDMNAANLTAKAIENAKRSLETMKADDQATRSALEALQRADSFRSGSATN